MAEGFQHVIIGLGHIFEWNVSEEMEISGVFGSESHRCVLKIINFKNFNKAMSEKHLLHKV